MLWMWNFLHCSLKKCSHECCMKDPDYGRQLHNSMRLLMLGFFFFFCWTTSELQPNTGFHKVVWKLCPMSAKMFTPVIRQKDSDVGAWGREVRLLQCVSTGMFIIITTYLQRFHWHDKHVVTMNKKIALLSGSARISTGCSCVFSHRNWVSAPWNRFPSSLWAHHGPA